MAHTGMLRAFSRSLAFAAVVGAVASFADVPMHLPGPPSPRPVSPRLKAMKAQAVARPYGPNWRETADTAVSESQYVLAADAYRREAAIYMRNGDVQGARAELAKADRYQPDIAAYVRYQALASGRIRARLEPALGCYLGAYIDRDGTLGEPYMDENGQTHMEAGAFERATDRRHATYFMYMSYGRPFPWAWANALKRRGQIPHIAWEPASLAQVRDTDYLTRFAEDCARYNHPIFLRFASEMNGNWTRYHGDPAAYRRAFQTVAAAIHRTAPKAAMLWCPDARPFDAIAKYYPGDDAVDWVGVNFYSVLFYDNNRSRPAHDDPVDLLRPIYAKYATRKPIAVGEWAATHFQACDGRARPEFAAEKIARFYAALPRLFPGVKMVNWYDANNITQASGDRRLNNYQLTDESTVLAAYKAAVADPWFIGRTNEMAQVIEVPLKDGATVNGAARLSAWTKAPLSYTVYWSVDGKVRFATARPGAAEWTWNASKETPGAHRVSVLLYDSAGRYIAGRGWTVRTTR